MAAPAPNQHAASNVLHLSTSSIAVVYMAVFIDMLGMSIVLPVLPFLALEFGASSTLLGVVFSSYAGAQTLSVLFMGPLSDTYGRRPAILLSLAGSALGFLLQGFSRDIVSFIVWRAFTGLFGGSPPIAQAFVSDVFDDSRRPHYLALISSVIAMAFLFGPGMGAGLSEFSLYTPLFVASGLSFVSLVVAYMYLPESNPRVLEQQQQEVSQKEEEETKEVEEHQRQEDTTGHEQKQDNQAAVHMDLPDLGATGRGSIDRRSTGESSSQASLMSRPKKALDAREETKEKELNAPHTAPTIGTSEITAHVADQGQEVSSYEQRQQEELEALKQEEEERGFFHVVAAVCTGGFFNGSAFSVMQSMFALYVAEKYGLHSLQIGFVFVGMAILFIVSQALLFGRLQTKVGLLNTNTAGALMHALGLACIPSTDSFAVTCLFAGVAGMGYALVNPSVPSLLSRMAGTRSRGQLLSYGQSVSALSRVVAPVLYGALYEGSTVVPFVVAGSCAVLCAMASVTLSRWDTGLHHLKMKAEPSVSDSEDGRLGGAPVGAGLGVDQPMISRLSQFRHMRELDVDLEHVVLTDEELVHAEQYGVAVARLLKSRRYTRFRWPEAPELSRFLGLVLPDLGAEADEEMWRDSLLRVLNNAMGIGYAHMADMAHM